MSLLNNLEEVLMMPNHKLMAFIKTSPHRYKKYEIEKRNGKGKRLIAHPSKELKFIQRFLVDKLTDELPIHNSAMAYRKGINIKENANYHKNSSYILKMDFKDFFPSIKPEFLFKVLDKLNIDFPPEDLMILELLLFYKKYRGSQLTLSIGAPSSPLISNFVMFLFDSNMSLYCKEKKIKYTRYADDLIFSTNQKNVLFNIPSKVKEFHKKYCFEFLEINGSKTVFSSKAHNRFITGITITNENKLSLGRKRKRIISSMVHKYMINQLDEEKKMRLRGLLSFSKDIEPDFLKRLNKKYGQRTINEIMSLKID